MQIKKTIFCLPLAIKAAEISQDGLILRNYAPSLLSEYIDDSIIVDNVLSHGCHCAWLDKLNLFQEHLRGPDTVDVLDEICKNWIKARACNDRFIGGTCNMPGNSGTQYLRDGHYSYDLDTANDTMIQSSSCVPAGSADADDKQQSCNEDSCTIDLHFVKLIQEFVSDNPTFPVNNVINNGTCADAPVHNSTMMCVGTAPDLKAVPTNGVGCMRQLYGYFNGVINDNAQNYLQNWQIRSNMEITYVSASDPNNGENGNEYIEVRNTGGVWQTIVFDIPAGFSYVNELIVKNKGSCSYCMAGWYSNFGVCPSGHMYPGGCPSNGDGNDLRQVGIGRHNINGYPYLYTAGLGPPQYDLDSASWHGTFNQDYDWHIFKQVQDSAGYATSLSFTHCTNSNSDMNDLNCDDEKFLEDGYLHDDGTSRWNNAASEFLDLKPAVGVYNGNTMRVMSAQCVPN